MRKRSGSKSRSNRRRAGRPPNSKRTNASCDTCKGRKTKALPNHALPRSALYAASLNLYPGVSQIISRLTNFVVLVPGPCNYCASISVPCTISIPRKQRPFYLVSEEEYRYGIEILQKLFPNIELNIDSLRGLAQNMDALQTAAAVVSKPVRLPAAHAQQGYADDPSSVPCSGGLPEPTGTPPSMVPLGGMTSSNPVDGLENRDDSLLAQLFVQQKASVVKDSLGATTKLLENRIGPDQHSGYIGPGSDLPFIAAVRAYAKGEGLLSPPRNVQHHIKLPPPSPESRSSLSDFSRPTYFPPQASWRPHIDRYFGAVNSTYWLISVESFCSRLDDTYATQSYQTISPSWLCFLYAILAITNQNPESSAIHESENNVNLPDSDLQTSGDPYTSNNYISMSKSLVKEVMDEANLDSIRALSAMSIFLHNQGFAVPAYLNVGTAVRIAYTLGLHSPESYAEMTTINRETALRVAWTLYELDACISRPSGRPCNIDERTWHPVIPTEMTVASGTYDPWGLFNHSVAFNLEDQKIYAKLSRLSDSGDQCTALQEIRSSVAVLQSWYDNLPLHLQVNATVAPPHKRPVAHLHLRYWNKIISITRLALLADMQSMEPPRTNQQRRLSRMGQLCVDASERSQEILEHMLSSDDLSSLTVVDTKYILDVALVSLLLLTQRQSTDLERRLDQCISLLQSMDNLGFCRYAGGDLLRIAEAFRTRFGRGGDRFDRSLDAQMHAGETDVRESLLDIGMEYFWTQHAWTAVTLGWNTVALSPVPDEENFLQSL
ncbi:hypothetical protein AnigIFM62618_005317 [Aspergillus niger]|nr:hypothetical protein AnigIFM62618_005317 [Aspergillus niger]